MKTKLEILRERQTVFCLACGNTPATGEEWAGYLDDPFVKSILDAMDEYASQLMDDLLQRAADNACTRYNKEFSSIEVDKASIINTEKILL